MTDRFHSLVVVLDCDIRDDDAQNIITAIKALRHVVTVTGEVADLASNMAEARAKRALKEKLWEALK